MMRRLLRRDHRGSRGGLAYPIGVTSGGKPLADDDPRHGTRNGYGNHGCRCHACRAANAAAHAEYIKRRRAEGRVIGRHGSSLAYDTGCRCNACRLAHNARSVETKRRIRDRNAQSS
jgi:hypothetical protein